MKNYQMTINDEQNLEELSPLAYIDTWEPHIVEEKMGRTVHWLNHSETDETIIMTGVWKHIPEDESNNEFYFRYGNNDMMLYVLEGEAEYSKPIPMRMSDKFFFPNGTQGTWQTMTPFAKLFIQTNSSKKT